MGNESTVSTERVCEPKGPTVSVVCCTHNRAAFARSHFEGLRCQLGEDIELLYALDNCTDATRATLEGLTENHPKVRVLEHRGARGLFNCRNFGIANARGSYIHFLDDDDSVEPGFYARACAGLKTTFNPSVDIYLTRLRISTDAGQAGEREVIPPELMRHGVMQGDELHLKGDMFGPILQGRLYFNGANALFSTAVLKHYGYRTELKKSADWLFILEAALRQPLHMVYNAQIVANYYVHAKSMSLAPDKAIWNARVFELLLTMAHYKPDWSEEIRTRCAKANLDAGYALRRRNRRQALRHYLRVIACGQYIQGIKAIMKLPGSRVSQSSDSDG